ncbi:MAG: glutamine synthetase, partial [Boseongicola sp. SB0673_bin_14]|nr:glutamine synthetase [Boseongicola sp. SB0673_bin_14]
APTSIAYGFNNRSAQFRLPQNRHCIENRACDMTMNVYLAMAMHLSCAVDGIKNKIDPGEPADFDLYAKSESELKEVGVRRLPRTLWHATQALRDDDLAGHVMGRVMRHSYVEYKEDEWERYHQAVTDWEVQEYLRLY